MWNETLTFQLGQNEDEMTLVLVDRCMLGDAKLGEGNVDNGVWTMGCVDNGV